MSKVEMHEYMIADGSLVHGKPVEYRALMVGPSEGVYSISALLAEDIGKNARRLVITCMDARFVKPVADELAIDGQTAVWSLAGGPLQDIDRQEMLVRELRDIRLAMPEIEELVLVPHVDRCAGVAHYVDADITEGDKTGFVEYANTLIRLDLASDRFRQAFPELRIRTGVARKIENQVEVKMFE